MADANIGPMAAEMANILATALKGLRPNPVHTLRLGRFMGHPTKSGDPTVAAWLDEFEVYARQMGVPEGERAILLIDHLGGAAKEKVLCHPEAVRESLEHLK